MRTLTLAAVLALLGAVSAVPITPAAPEHQYLAESMRSEGISEREIAQRLSSTSSESNIASLPRYEQITSRLNSLLWKSPERDATGDISPGSLDAPEMLPRASAPESLTEAIRSMVRSVLNGEDFENHMFAYEGKEGEMRRPEGMRYWG